MTSDEGIDLLRRMCCCPHLCPGFGDTCPKAHALIVLLRKLQVYDFLSEQNPRRSTGNAIRRNKKER